MGFIKLVEGLAGVAIGAFGIGVTGLGIGLIPATPGLPDEAIVIPAGVGITTLGVSLILDSMSGDKKE
jgi:hypothetical protein